MSKQDYAAKMAAVSWWTDAKLSKWWAELNRVPATERAAKGSEAARSAAPTPAALPCLSSNNCVGTPKEGEPKPISSSTRKTLWALTQNVEKFCYEHGIEWCVFGTITFPDPVVDMKEAQRRLHSFATFLKPRFPWMVIGVHRRKNRVIHFHFVAGAPVDVKTGFDFEAAKNRDYRSACSWLKKEWKAWRAATNYDGRRAHKVAYPEIGRFEIAPIKKNGVAAARYMAGYIRDGLQYRDASDRGKRLIRYWGRPRKTRAIKGQFAWSSLSPLAWLHRQKVAQAAFKLDCDTLADLQQHHGPKWCYHLRQIIADQRLPYYPSVRYAHADDQWWADLLPPDAVDIEPQSAVVENTRVFSSPKSRGDPF